MTRLAGLLLTPLAACCAERASAQALDRQWAALGGSGKLEYKTTPKGDRIADFSHAGYMGGGVAIPVLPVKKEVAPSGGDDSAAIQAAVDEVAVLPLARGWRGAVLLKPGTFHCAKPIILAREGVVLRGSGSGKGGTLLELSGEPHTAVTIEGPELSGTKEVSANAVAITDAYVPAGALSVAVKDARGLAAGDDVCLRWTRAAAWVHFMGMDTLVRNGKPQTWIKDGSVAAVQRNIRAVSGNRVTLDVPLTDAIDAQFLGRQPAVLAKVPPAKRLSQCGLESLQITSPAHRGTLTAGKYISVALAGGCEDCWVKDIVMRETLVNVQVGEGCRRVTITGTHAYHASSVEKGAGYPADIALRGSQVLVDRCSSHGMGGFYVATMNATAALNVVLNCTFEGDGSIMPHMRWSTGLLVDSCHLPGGRIDLINRGTSGSGHGWSIGWGVAWNCDAKNLQVQTPPGALNLAVGCRGEPYKTCSPEAFFSHGAPVFPASLYLAQLRERLGAAAVKNIGY